MRNKILRYLTAFLFLASTPNFVAPQAKAAGTPGYGSLTFGCAQGPQNGLNVPPTPSNFAGCTITVYNHGTSTLSGTYYNSTGSALTNPVVLTLGTGTVTTSGTTVTEVSGAFVTTGAWVGQQIVIQGVPYTISSVGSSSSITTVQTLPTISSATAYTVTPLSDTVYLQDGWYDVCVSNATSTPILQGGCNYGLVVAQNSFAANKAQLTGAFTDANASGLQAITGLSFSVPSTFVGNLSFSCSVPYSQATPSAGDAFGLAVLTTAPTRLDAVDYVNTAATGAGVTGPITNLTSTTPTAFGTFTPGSTVVYNALINGTVQLAGGGAQTLQVYIQNGTAADTIAIAAGAYCALF